METKVTKDGVKAAGKNIAEKGAIGLVYAGILGICAISTYNEMAAENNMTYSTCVDKIVNSNMSNVYKAKIMKALPEDRESEFYKSIVKVVESDMMSTYKSSVILEMIK